MAEITSALQSLVVTVVIALIGLVATSLVTYIGVLKKKAVAAIESIDNETFQNALKSATDKASELVVNVVTSIEQEEKQEILKAMEDGTVDRDELLNLKHIAVERITSQLGAESIKILETAFGDISAYIGDLVSKQVYTLKNPASDNLITTQQTTEVSTNG